MSHVRSDGDISKREHLYKREQSLTLHTPSITRRTGHTHTHPPHRRLYSALVSIFLAACLFVIAHCGSPQLSGPSKGLSLRAAVDKERRRKGLAVTLSAGKAIEAQVKVKTFFCESHLQRAGRKNVKGFHQPRSAEEFGATSNLSVASTLELARGHCCRRNVTCGRGDKQPPCFVVKNEAAGRLGGRGSAPALLLRLYSPWRWFGAGKFILSILPGGCSYAALFTVAES